MSTLGLEIGLGVVGALALVGIGTAFVRSKKYVSSEPSERHSDSNDFRTPEERENADNWEKSRNQAYADSQARNDKIIADYESKLRNEVLSGGDKRKTKRKMKRKRIKSKRS